MYKCSPCSLAVCALIGTGMLFAGVRAAGCRPEPGALRVTTLHVTRPAIIGQFATATCSIRNTGKRPAPLGMVFIGMSGSGGLNQPFSIAPPDSALPAALKPGQSITIRRFRKLETPGRFSCVISVRSGGEIAPITFLDGRPAATSFEVIPAAAAPDVRFLVSDPGPRHIYRAGDTIHVRITPLVSEGPDLSSSVESLSVSPGAKPFSMTDPGAARSILLEHQHTGPNGFLADFWSVDAARRYLDITIRFKNNAALSSFRLSGENLNDQYGLKSCAVVAIGSDGKMTALPVMTLTDQARWTISSAMPRSVIAHDLRLRVFTLYKLNVTDLWIRGTAGSVPKMGGPAKITCRWQNQAGRPLSRPIDLMPFQQSAIVSPPRLQPGYYGLAVTTHIPGVDELHHEYGFVALPIERAHGPSSSETDPRFGMVHMDLNDPNLGVGGVKTLGTAFYDPARQTLDTAAWQNAMRDRRTRGFTELPLVSGGAWDSDNDHPIRADQLHRIQTMMEQYFKADPNIPAWELGIEENLGYRVRVVPFYWANLDRKARAVRTAAATAGAKVKLVYQIAELDPASVEAFLRSSASRQFDVLSLHPYAWPDFPPPEKWLPAYIDQVRALMKRYHATKPIWFTEIGAPVDGDPGGFFGYPSNGVDDRGLSRREYADYMVKCNLLALQLGVEKIFWYHYRDWGSDPQFAEDHFGLVDFWGFPMPAYAAYSTMTRMLRGEQFRASDSSHGNIRALRFEGAGHDLLVLWTYPAEIKSISLRQIGIAPANVLGAVDLWGRPVALRNSFTISGEPLYLKLRAAG